MYVCMYVCMYSLPESPSLLACDTSMKLSEENTTSSTLLASSMACFSKALDSLLNRLWHYGELSSSRRWTQTKYASFSVHSLSFSRALFTIWLESTYVPFQMCHGWTYLSVWPIQNFFIYSLTSSMHTM